MVSEDIDILVHEYHIRHNQHVNFESVNPRECFTEALRQHAVLIKQAQAVVLGDLAEGLIICSVKAYWLNIFTQVLENALIYRESSRKPVILFRIYRSLNEVIFECSDNGIGIDTERHKKRLFGFKTTFHDYPGSHGVQLFLIRAQVEAMNGTIEADGKVGVGLTIKIKIPQ
jgi:signal transduction histidine kinase